MKVFKVENCYKCPYSEYIRIDCGMCSHPKSNIDDLPEDSIHPDCPLEDDNSKKVLEEVEAGINTIIDKINHEIEANPKMKHFAKRGIKAQLRELLFEIKEESEAIQQFGGKYDFL